MAATRAAPSKTFASLPPLPARAPMMSAQASKPLADVARRVASAPINPTVKVQAPKIKSDPVSTPDKYGRCDGCNREMLKSTLERQGNMCMACKKKAEKGEEVGKKPAARSVKSPCKGCGTHYTKATLTKYEFSNGEKSGMCKKCTDGANKKAAGEIVVEKPQQCLGNWSEKCEGASTNPKTWKKYSGLCHPCVVALCATNMGETYKAVVEGVKQEYEEEAETEPETEQNEEEYE